MLEFWLVFSVTSIWEKKEEAKEVVKIFSIKRLHALLQSEYLHLLFYFLFSYLYKSYFMNQSFLLFQSSGFYFRENFQFHRYYSSYYLFNYKIRVYVGSWKDTDNG